MSSAPTIPAIRGTVTVGVPVERAFGVFTDSFHTWWPADYHIGQAEMATAIIEPRAGGRWYEKGVDGSERDWGRGDPRRRTRAALGRRARRDARRARAAVRHHPRADPGRPGQPAAAVGGVAHEAGVRGWAVSAA
jgi:hypothetical protein